HFTRSTKHSAGVFEFRYDNILNRQISARMEQWNRVQKAFDGARTQLKPLIHNAFADEIFQQPGLDSGRQGRIQNALNGDESFFQSHRVPYLPPERDAFFDAGRMDVLRPDFEQPVHRSSEFTNRNAKGLGDPRGGRRRDIASNLDEVQLSIAHDELVRRQVVVNTGQV